MKQPNLQTIEKKFGIRIIPVRIHGSRRAFIGVVASEPLPIALPARLRVDEEHGYVVYGYDSLSGERRRRLENELGALPEE
ncbi:MAG: hypothetical protein GF344_09820 [Chitinivibrionales bacterium]|nr:hypothetical protein [Chitinivibrionales bacterium]MBD3357137.1 hypothetical protein [Chitinivibrionales bacterium]